MSYSVDFRTMPITEFYEYLQNRKLFQSHRILKQNVKYYLDTCIELGIQTLDDLYQQIKTKSKLKAFQEKSSFDEDYLTILRRHVNSFVLKTRDIHDFVLLNEVDKELLLSEGATNSKTMFLLLDTLSFQDKDYLKGVLDLTRLRYVSAKFAEAIYMAGYNNLTDLSNASATELRDGVNEMITKYNLANVTFGLSDSQFLIDDATLYIDWLER